MIDSEGKGPENDCCPVPGPDGAKAKSVKLESDTAEVIDGGSALIEPGAATILEVGVAIVSDTAGPGILVNASWVDWG